jgi:ABC-type multidrug transport system permease subunit
MSFIVYAILLWVEGRTSISSNANCHHAFTLMYVLLIAIAGFEEIVISLYQWKQSDAMRLVLGGIPLLSAFGVFYVHIQKFENDQSDDVEQYLQENSALQPYGTINPMDSNSNAQEINLYIYLKVYRPQGCQLKVLGILGTHLAK